MGQLQHYFAKDNGNRFYVAEYDPTKFPTKADGLFYKEAVTELFKEENKLTDVEQIDEQSATKEKITIQTIDRKAKRNYGGVIEYADVKVTLFKTSENDEMVNVNFPKWFKKNTRLVFGYSIVGISEDTGKEVIVTQFMGVGTLMEMNDGAATLNEANKKVVAFAYASDRHDLRLDEPESNSTATTE